jgi:hypothetical protein
MAYLTSWRITLAADLLRETDHTVGTIAKKVGYANAFRTERGVQAATGHPAQRPQELATGTMAARMRPAAQSTGQLAGRNERATDRHSPPRGLGPPDAVHHRP